MFDGTNRRRHTDYSFDEGVFAAIIGEIEVDLGGGVVLVIVVVGDYDGRSVIFSINGNCLIIKTVTITILR